MATSDQALHENIADRAENAGCAQNSRVKTPSKDSEITQDLDKAAQIIRAGGVVAHATGSLGPSLSPRSSLSYRKDLKIKVEMMGRDSYFSGLV